MLSGWLRHLTRACHYLLLRYSLQKKHTCRARTASGRWRLRTGFALNVAEEAIRLHNLQVEENPEKLLKFDPKRRASHIVINGQHYVVKEFINAASRSIFSHDRKNWLNAFLARELGLPVATCFAWLRAGRNGYVLMEYLADDHLLTKIRSPELVAANLHLLQQAMKLLAVLHRNGIYHRDMKPENWIVAGDDLYLIDLEDLSFTRRVSPGLAVKSQQQLLARAAGVELYRPLLVSAYREALDHADGQ